jgi:hypothetical protein
MNSWVAIQQCHAAELLDYLGLVEIGESDYPPAARFSWAEFPNQWVVVFSQDFDWGSPERARELSRFGLALGCQFEDKVEMTSLLCAARDGNELWRVFHNSLGSIYRLDVTGEPPNELWSIRDRVFREQESDGGEEAGVDYVHDIPFELAQAICGYRHDEDETLFKELRKVGVPGPQPGARNPGFLAKLFGARR